MSFGGQSFTPSSVPSTQAEEEEEEEERAALDSLRRQLADIRRARREAESLRCVWRHAAWHSAWRTLSEIPRAKAIDVERAKANAAAALEERKAAREKRRLQKERSM